MQVLRSIIEHNFIPPPDIAIEFHWYAAEEHGLLGSQDIAAAYEEAEKDVKAMLQIDSMCHCHILHWHIEILISMLQ